MAFPNLVLRALRYLHSRPDRASSRGVPESELIAELFGASPSGKASPWSKMLRSVLLADPRFARLPSGAWTLVQDQKARADSLGGPCPANIHLKLNMNAPKNANEPEESGIVALAVGTSGPRPERHRLLCLVATKSGPPGQERVWQSAFRPDEKTRAPKYLLADGLSLDDLEAALSFGEEANDLREFLGGSTLVGLDVALAVAFIQEELRRADQAPLDNPLSDLAELARVRRPGAFTAKKPTLETLASLLKVPLGRPSLQMRSRAYLRIAQALSQVDTTIPTTIPKPNPEAESRKNGALWTSQRRLLIEYTEDESAPRSPGVYLFRDREDRVLYVGKATWLDLRLRSYLSSDVGRSRSMHGLAESVERIETIITRTELEARMLEARLIAHLQPRYNVQRALLRELAYLRLNEDAFVPKQKGVSRPSVFSLAAEPSEAGSIIVCPKNGKKLIAEARECFGLGRGREKSDWSERARLAWDWLLVAAAGSQVAPGLRGASLGSFSLLVPLPVFPPSDSASLSERELAWSAEDEEGGGDEEYFDFNQDRQYDLEQESALDDEKAEKELEPTLIEVHFSEKGWRAIWDTLPEWVGLAPSLPLAELTLARRYLKRRPNRLVLTSTPEEPEPFSMNN